MFYSSIEKSPEQHNVQKPPLYAAAEARPLVDLLIKLALVSVLGLSLVVLIFGWMLQNPAITHIAPGLAAMVPSTAFLLIIASATLLVRGYVNGVRRQVLVAGAAATLIAVALTNVIVLATTGYSGIDEALLESVGDFKTDRMSLATSLSFLLVATSFAASESTGKRAVYFVIAATLGLTVSVLAIIVYAFEAQSLYEVSLFTTMAIHTAMCLAIVFAATLWVRRDRGWVAILSGTGAGSDSARRLLPYCIAIPLICALLVSAAITNEHFDPTFGISLLAIVTMAVLFTIIVRDAKNSNRNEQEHLESITALAQLKASKDAVAESEANFRQLAQAMPVGIFRTDRDGTITYANAAMGHMLRSPPADLRDQPLADVLNFDGEDSSLLSADGSLEEADLSLLAQGDQVYVRAISNPILGGVTGAKGHVGALIDMTENREAMDALQEARDDAQAAARAKSSFLANMSHEIRTPMNGVLGFAQLLIDADLNTEHAKYAHLIHESGQSMVAILNDILDLSKIEAGQLTIQRERLNLHHTVRAAVRLMRGAAMQKDIGLTLDIDEDVPAFVHEDGLRLRQIIGNLVGNAIKFTAKGRVTVTLVVKGPHLRLRVADTGIGIPEDRLPHIFKEFVQSDGSVARRFGGTGLGLPISRKLTEMMGGTLTLSSVEGEGTVVELNVPLRACEAPCDSDDQPDDAASTPATQQASPARILVAEDNDINQVLITNLLSGLGHEVDLVDDGADAIAAIEKAQDNGEPYPLVLMDVQMPHVDGLEATNRLRRKGHEASELPIIAVTANAYESDIQECLDAGMQDHLVKPIRKEELAAVIGKWLGPTRL